MSWAMVILYVILPNVLTIYLSFKGRNDQGAKQPGGLNVQGRNVLGAKQLGKEMVWGRNVSEPNQLPFSVTKVVIYLLKTTNH